MISRVILQDESAIEFSSNETSNISHWHEETVEIILSLRGTVKVEIVGSEYIIKDDELIFVNKWMVHKIEKLTEDALFLVLRFNLKFFEKYVKNATKVFFVRVPNLHPEEHLSLLRNYIAQIIILIKKREDNFEKNIIEISRDLLKLMIKEFNYIEKNPELYRSQENFDRVWIALRYMLDNHNSKVTLSGLAEHVHVSDSYLSHCIKKETGKEFEYWLNLFRAENAARLLVSTKTSIVKISDACGFSDPKYLVKYFKKFFNYLPSEYREINLRETSGHKTLAAEHISDEENYFIELKMKAYVLGINRISLFFPYLKHLELNINCSEAGRRFSKTWTEAVDIGDYSNLQKGSFRYFLAGVQKDIGFDSALIDCPFDGSEVLCRKDQIVINLQDFFEAFDFLSSIGLKPSIRLNTRKHSREELENIAAVFFSNAAEMYGKTTLETWRCMIPQRFSDSIPLKKTLEEYNLQQISEIKNEKAYNYLYDTAYIAPAFIEKVLSDDFISAENYCNKLFDDDLINFEGDTGLFASGLKKPLYWAYYMLALLGDEILYKGDGYMVTRRHDDLQILLWNSSHSVDLIETDKLSLTSGNRYVVFENERPIMAEINIDGLSSDKYIVKKLLLDRNNGSIFDRLEDVKVVEYLTRDEKAALNEMCTIKASYNLVSGNSRLYLREELPVNGVIIYLITKQKKVEVIKAL